MGLRKAKLKVTGLFLFLSLPMALLSCTKSPFGNSQGEMSQRNLTRFLQPSTGSTSPAAGSVGAIALSVGEQMITRLETDLKGAGLTDEQIKTIANEARNEAKAEAGKIVISTLSAVGFWIAEHTGFDLLDQNSQIMSIVGSAVARGAIKSLSSDALKNLPGEFKQNTLGTMSSSVMSSMVVSPEKLSDASIQSVASSLIGSMVTALPSAGISGDLLLSSMSKVMEKAVGSLDEAGLSADSTAQTVVAMTQSTLSKASEITKGTAFEGNSIGTIAAAAIQGLGATKASSAQSMSTIESVTVVSVKAAVSLDSSKVDLAKSIENLTSLTTKALSSVTSAADTVGGLERMMGAATQAVADSNTTKSADFFAKMTAGIVAGSVSAVDSVTSKTGTGAASIVKSLVSSAATKAVQISTSTSDIIKVLSEVTGSAVKALANSSVGNDAAIKSDAVGSAVAGTVTALAKMTSQDSATTSAAIQGISKAGTQAVSEITQDKSALSNLTKSIVSSGIAAATTSLAGTDQTKLLSMASDMTRGAATGIATIAGIDMSEQVKSLAGAAVQAVNQAGGQVVTSGDTSSMMSSFASNVANAITAGLAVGGQSTAAITAINTSLSTAIVDSVIFYAPTLNSTTLAQSVQTQVQAGIDLATTISAGTIPLCKEKFDEGLSDGDFIPRLEGKRTGVFCRMDLALPICPRPRLIEGGEYFWAMMPPDLCEFRPIPLMTNTAATTIILSPMSTSTSTSSTNAYVSLAPLPAVDAYNVMSYAVSGDCSHPGAPVHLNSPQILQTSCQTNNKYLFFVDLTMIPDGQVLFRVTHTGPSNSDTKEIYIPKNTSSGMGGMMGTSTSSGTYMGTSTYSGTGTSTGTSVGYSVGLGFVSDTFVELNWAPLTTIVTGVTEYKIYRNFSPMYSASDAESSFFVKQVASGITWETDGGLTSNTDYYYAVVAYDTTGNKAFLGYVYARTGPTTLASFDPNTTTVLPPKGFYDLNFHNHWALVGEAGGLRLRYTQNNNGSIASWLDGGFLPNSNYGDFDVVTFTDTSGTTHAFIFVEDGEDALLFKATLNSTGATIGSPIYIFTGTGYFDRWVHPRLAVSQNKLIFAAHKVSAFGYSVETTEAVVDPSTMSLSLGSLQNQGYQQVVYDLSLVMGSNDQVYLTSNGSQLLVRKRDANTAWAPLSSGQTSYIAEGLAMAIPAGSIYAFAHDPNTNTLYVGGDFRSMNGVAGTGFIAKWQGGQWYPLDLGVNGTVRALAFDTVQNRLYVGGDFTHAGSTLLNHVGIWDGQNWKPMQMGLKSMDAEPGAVYAIEIVDSNNVYLGGHFHVNAGSGTTSFNHVARWDGGQLQPLGFSGQPNGVGFNGTVFAIEALSAIEVYLGGAEFGISNLSLTSGSLVKWNGTNFFHVDNGIGSRLLGGVVHTLKEFSGSLYAGGEFGPSDFIPSLSDTQNFARLNLSTQEWSAAGSIGFSGAQGKVNSMAVFNGYLYIGGSFDSAPNSAPLKNLAKMDSSQNWYQAGAQNATDGMVRSLFSVGSSTLYIGGDFQRINTTISAQSLAKLEPSTLSAFGGSGDPIDGKIFDAAIASNGDIYVVGDFTKIAGITAKKVAKWTFSSKAWSAIGADNCTGAIEHVEIHPTTGELFVAGDVANCGAAMVGKIARFNGSSWVLLNDNPTGVLNDINQVHDMKFDPLGNLYIVGDILARKDFLRYNTSAQFEVLATTGGDIEPKTIHIVESVNSNPERAIILGGSANWEVSPNSIPVFRTVSSSWETLSVPGQNVTAFAGTDLNNLYVVGNFGELDAVSHTAKFAKLQTSSGITTVLPIVGSGSELDPVSSEALFGVIEDGGSLLVAGEYFEATGTSGFGGFGIWKFGAMEWNNSLRANGPVQKLIKAPSGAPYVAIAIGDFLSIGPVGATQIAMIRRSELGVGSPYGVAFDQKETSSPGLLISRGKTLEMLKHISNVWGVPAQVATASSDNIITNPQLHASGAGDSYMAMWLDGTQIKSRGSNGGTWTSVQSILSLHIPTLFWTENSMDSISKLIFAEYQGPNGPGFRVVATPYPGP